MNRIEEKFKQLKKQEETALMPYITAGDPTLGFTKKLIKEFEASGVDMIELGVPYSDPLADGPTIQQAAQRALSAGADLEQIFGLIEEVRTEVEIPIILMGYYNSFYKYSLQEVVSKAEEVGVDGLIIPDLPPEEAEEVEKFKNGDQLSSIFLLAPTSSEERMELVNQQSDGFIYCVSTLGVTGARNKLSSQLQGFLARVRQHSDQPLAVGFGISAPKQAAQVAKYAEGVIVGSAIIDRIAENLDQREEVMLKEVSSLVKRLKKAL
ncbi:tryptophan synthase subunit alpha [Acetohalobium arabaticum]|uniref:Tryptophan synthase alpha chain n=1 Tax=Acetohalobium arabaticum (strain ATCC 49924 / DSM 5501 / Z-7288) TaxID=574087 RepID=D9QS77_ACEAZ|nr:tryptophan synthase subunit alpha [Acetohalobium arabaticum]ADL13368.1 tryptophan synthase, alpha subunit [Acetohalobium arabaticum DSM 5501]